MDGIQTKFKGFYGEWSQAAYTRAKGKVCYIPSVEEILKEWCPIRFIYEVTFPDTGESYEMPFELKRKPPDEPQ